MPKDLSGTSNKSVQSTSTTPVAQGVDVLTSSLRLLQLFNRPEDKEKIQRQEHNKKIKGLSKNQIRKNSEQKFRGKSFKKADEKKSETKKETESTAVTTADSSKPGTVFNNPQISYLQNDNALRSWTETSGSGVTAYNIIYGQNCNQYGSATGEKFVIDEFEGSYDKDHDPKITMLKNGNYVCSWQQGSRVFSRVFSGSNNKPLAEKVAIGDSEFSPEVTSLKDGNFVVGYGTTTGSTPGIKFQRFGASGSAIGEEFNFTTSRTDTTIGNFTVTSTADGGFVAAQRYYDKESNRDFLEVASYSADGVTPHPLMNRMIKSQGPLSMSVGDDGNLIIAYYGYDQRVWFAKNNVTNFDISIGDPVSDTSEPIAIIPLVPITATDSSPFMIASIVDGHKIVGIKTNSNLYSKTPFEIADVGLDNSVSSVSLTPMKDGGFVASFSKNSGDKTEVMEQRFDFYGNKTKLSEGEPEKRNWPALIVGLVLGIPTAVGMIFFSIKEYIENRTQINNVSTAPVRNETEEDEEDKEAKSRLLSDPEEKKQDQKQDDNIREASEGIELGRILAPSHSPTPEETSLLEKKDDNKQIR